MRVIIGKTVYEMTEKQLNNVLAIAKKLVPVGIYAIRKDDIVELKKKPYKTKGYMKKVVSGYENKGFYVYYNGGDK